MASEHVSTTVKVEYCTTQPLSQTTCRDSTYIGAVLVPSTPKSSKEHNNTRYVCTSAHGRNRCKSTRKTDSTTLCTSHLKTPHHVWTCQSA
ncbi:hypothetical protein M3J09_003044 [Ascochyta lentis]